jgi:hypothetical protein
LVERLHVPDATDLAGQHHFAGLLQGRDIAIGEVDHRDEAGGLRGAGHLVRFGIAFRQRLLAHHMLARRQQRQRRRMVRAVGRDIGGRIEAIPGNGLLQRREDMGYAMRIRESLGAHGIHVDGADQFDAVDRSKVLGMAVGHAAGSKNKKTHHRPQR